MPGGAAVLGRLAAAILVVVGACSTPEPNRASSDPDRPTPQPSTAPNAPSGSGGPRRDATLTGRIVDREGLPLVGVPVSVSEEGGFGDAVGAVLTAGFTFGIACVSDPQACDGGDRVVDGATTDADGRYALTLPDAYLPGYETDADWILTVGRAPAEGEVTGPSSTYELEVNTAVQDAPDLALWEAAPTITDRDGVLVVAVPPLTATPAAENVSVRFVGAAGSPLWGVAGTTVDPRVLEDQAVGLVASSHADVAVPHDDGRTIYHQGVLAPTSSYVSTLVPPSRGAACTVADGPGFVGCPLTDGDLRKRVELVGAVSVDLGAPTELGLVVARMASPFRSGELVFEISEDGASWTTLDHRDLDGAEGFSASPRPGQGIPTIRYLRVSAGDGSLEVIELSVWGPTAADRARAEVPVGGIDGGAADDPAGVPVALAVIAVAAAAVGAVIVRRRIRTNPGGGDPTG